MPLHTSKNFYKAEQEYLDLKIREEWSWSPRHCWYDDCGWDNWFDCRLYEECMCLRGESCGICRYEVDKSCACCHRVLPDCKYSCKDPSCEICYDYITVRDRKELIEESFTHQQILETLQTHLKDTNCWCYNRIQNAIKRDRIERHIRARRCSTDIIIPGVLEVNHIPPCVVKLLDKQLGKEIRALHRQRDFNEKLALLTKYGLTLEDYMNRKNIEETSNVLPQELTEALPKQKFIKVKESTLQIGEF